jgi:hypothetical protein
MHLWSWILALGLPVAAWSADIPAPAEGPVPDASLVVKVGDQELKTADLETGRGEADVKDFESFLLVNMARRGVCLDKLGPAFYERLHRVLAKTAAENPTRFRYFLLMAPQFEERQVTDIFVVLRDAPEGFPRYVESQVRFFRPQTALASQPEWGKSGPQDGEPAMREEHISEAAIREYKRYQMHCPLMWVGDETSGPPPAQCGYQTYDLQAAFARVMGDSFGSPGSGTGFSGKGSAGAVSATGPLGALGPSEAPSR